MRNRCRSAFAVAVAGVVQRDRRPLSGVACCATADTAMACFTSDGLGPDSRGPALRLRFMRAGAEAFGLVPAS
jgi:hypothetical protein